MKFGGSSVADAERILGITEIVRLRLERRPVVVVSALAGVTDLLERAVVAARRDQLEQLEPVLADLERRHRWALAGCVETAGPRHDLGLEIDGMFEDLRQRLRSIRILGEGTPRAADSLLAFGETLAARIVAAAFRDRGLPASCVDARQVMVTDQRFGAAEPDLDSVHRRCAEQLLPRLDGGELPVLGGFVGSTAEGQTTTLGRGGSDTSAAVLGSALGAEEIQIWTDVDGFMTADPRKVPAARRLERLSFAEAAELAFHGARVLHPASIAPAVQRQIPVRVLNSLRPAGEGTVILGERPGADAPPLASLASRGGTSAVRITDRRMRRDPGFLRQVLSAIESLERTPDLVIAGEVTVSLAVHGSVTGEQIDRRLGDTAAVEVLDDRALVCTVGAGLGESRVRARVLQALAEWDPDMVALGASRIGVTAVIREAKLEEALRRLHLQFFER